MGAGEMARELESPAALADSWVQFPGPTLYITINQLYNSRPRGSGTLYWCLKFTCIHPHTHTYSFNF